MLELFCRFQTFSNCSLSSFIPCYSKELLLSIQERQYDHLKHTYFSIFDPYVHIKHVVFDIYLLHEIVASRLKYVYLMLNYIFMYLDPGDENNNADKEKAGSSSGKKFIKVRFGKIQEIYNVKVLFCWMYKYLQKVLFANKKNTSTDLLNQ